MGKPAFWKNDKRYYDLKSYWRNLFGCVVHKLQIDAGFTCPNRDGRIAFGGCIYCDGRGSKLRQEGPLPSVTEQILLGKSHYAQTASKFIAYFQTFTNTYAPVEKLEALYDEALHQKDVIGLSIGTRPDCLDPDVVGLLADYAKRYHVWIELGLQSVHDRTLKFINRGHLYRPFIEAIDRLVGKNILICVHIILGLPGETDEDIHQTAQTLAALPLNGIKIHSLLALDGTPMGDLYKKGKISMLTKEKYAALVADVLEFLPPDVVIQRLTADGYRDIFLAPAWAANKLDVLNAIHRELDRRNSYQGMRHPST